MLVLLTAFATRSRNFIQTQWGRHGHRLKTPTGQRVVRAFGITVLVCFLAYGCQFAVHHPERVRIENVQRAEQERRDAELARIRWQEAQAREEAWQQYARDNSNHPLTYEIVYTSWFWLPLLGVVALVYALASRAYLFMAIGKTLLLSLFLTSLALLVGDATPAVVEWEFFQAFKATVTQLAAHLNVPVAPPLWLAISLVGGIVVESLSRWGSRSKIILKPANVVVQPAHVVVNIPPHALSNVPSSLPPPLPPKY